MNLSDGYPEFELSLVPEHRIDDISVLLDSSEKIDGERFFELIDDVSITVYRCPSCDRLHVDSGKGIFKSYIPEVDP